MLQGYFFYIVFRVKYRIKNFFNKLLKVKKMIS